MNEINRKISDLMQDVQNAALESDTDPTQADYLADVVRRMLKTERALQTLRAELRKHGLND